MKKSSSLPLSIACAIILSSYSFSLADTPAKVLYPTLAPASDEAVLKSWVPSLSQHLQAASTLLNQNHPNTEYLDSIAFYDISEAYAALGNYSEAEKMASHVKDSVQRSNALLMAGVRKAKFDNDSAGARRLFALAKAAAVTETNQLSRDKANADLVRGYAQIGEPTGSMALLPLIKDDGYRGVARLWMAESMVERKDVSFALENLRLVSANEDASMQMLLVIKGYIKAGQLEKAREIVNANTITRKERQVESIVAITLAEGLKGDAARKSLQPAIELAAGMEDSEEGDKGKAIEAIAKAQISMGDLDGAEKLLATVTATNAYDAHVELAKALSEAGQIEKAKDLATMALQANNGANLNIDMLCEIGKVQWKTDSKVANQTFADAVHQADAMGKTTSERNWALVRVVNSMAQTKSYRWAEMLANLINMPRPKSQALAYVAIAEARGGETKRAEDTFEEALASIKENSVPETVSGIAELVRLVSDELLNMKVEY